MYTDMIMTASVDDVLELAWNGLTITYHKPLDDTRSEKVYLLVRNLGLPNCHSLSSCYVEIWFIDINELIIDTVENYL